MPSSIIICRVDECPAKFNRDKPMKVLDETFNHWVFQCQTCLNLRTVSKDRVGGTRMSGRREDVPPRKWIGAGI